MDTSETKRSLTPELIERLLAPEARVEMSPAYVRLMEIYCVVKAGGVATQIEVAKQLQQREQTALQKEIAALVHQPPMVSRIEALQQEMREVERSVSNRVVYLQSIDAVEEANVQHCLAMIDGYFANLGKTR